MKKLLEKELKNLAREVLQFDNETEVGKLKAAAADLYEKLSVLDYSQKHVEKEELQPVVAVGHTKKEDEQRYAPDGTEYNPEAITEPNTEKIKDIVAQMPPETEDMDDVLENILPEEKKPQEDWRNLGIHYDDLPQFEPVKKPSETKKEGKPSKKPEEEKGAPPTFDSKKEVEQHQPLQKKSLNDRLKKGVSFGLNDRLVYVKHLFDGNAPDFDRVLSQLNTFQSFDGAKRFIETVVKPDYNNWNGEETYEKRFLKALETKLA